MSQHQTSCEIWVVGKGYHAALTKIYGETAPNKTGIYKSTVLFKFIPKKLEEAVPKDGHLCHSVMKTLKFWKQVEGDLRTCQVG